MYKNPGNIEGESSDRIENSEEATFSKLFNLILILELFNPNRWLVASVLAVVCKRMQQLATTCNNMKQGVQTEATCNIQQCWELLFFPRLFIFATQNMNLTISNLHCKV